MSDSEREHTRFFRILGVREFDSPRGFQPGLAMSLRRFAVAGLMLSTIFAACTLPERRPLRPESLVGDYILRCDDRGAPCDRGTLTLRADGKYVLRGASPWESGGDEQGVWRFEGGSHPRVAVGDRGLPVELRGEDVGLLVDDDLGEYYWKIK